MNHKIFKRETTCSMRHNYISIETYIKNRYPFLMVDRLTKLEPGKYAEGYKNCTSNDWFFPCHYEGHMNMPGMIQLSQIWNPFYQRRINMTNLEKYNKIFVETLEVAESELPGLAYQGTENWDSVGHMQLMSELEDAFDIMLDTDDIIDFSSYEKGKEILKKYEIEM